MYMYVYCMYNNYCLLTFACIGKTGSYFNHCLSVPKLQSKLWMLAFCTRYEQTPGIKQSIIMLFLKHFHFKVMTIFITHKYCFTTFRRLLIANKYTKIQYMYILFKGYCCPDHYFKSSKIVIVAAKTLF